MSDDQNMDVNKENVAPSVDETGEQEQRLQKEPSQGSSEYNFREMRKSLEESQRRIRELEMMASRNSAPQQEDEDDDDEPITGDDFVTAKQVEKLALRKAQELIKQKEVESLEDRMRLKYKDYDEIVTEENVKQLIEDDRDLADSIRSAPNPYGTAYKLIKKSSFFSQKENTLKKRAIDADRLVKNSQKPISSNTVQSKPIANANSFVSMSDESLKEAYKEMMEYASRRH